MYEDILLPLKYSYDTKGIDNEFLLYNDAVAKNLLKNDNTTQCIFFGTKYREFYIPKNSILTDFDPTYRLEQLFTKDMVNDNTIVSYTKYNLDFLKNHYSPVKCGMFYMGYCGYQDQQEDTVKDIDVCFLGNFEERRVKIMNDLKKNYKCVHAYGIFASERQKLYNRSKIVLSLPSSEYMKNFTNGSRIFPAVSNNAFCISEKCLDDEQNNVLKNISVTVQYDDIVKTVDYFMENEKERIQLQKQFYENVKGILCRIEMMQEN
jgi:hypothetical protein